jgi:hypothetical protein
MDLIDTYRATLGRVTPRHVGRLEERVQVGNAGGTAFPWMLE